MVGCSGVDIGCFILYVDEFVGVVGIENFWCCWQGDMGDGEKFVFKLLKVNGDCWLFVVLGWGRICVYGDEYLFCG